MSQSGFEMFSNVAGMVIVIADVIFFYALWNIFCKNKKEKMSMMIGSVLLLLNIGLGFISSLPTSGRLIISAIAILTYSIVRYKKHCEKPVFILTLFYGLRSFSLLVANSVFQYVNNSVFQLLDSSSENYIENMYLYLVYTQILLFGLYIVLFALMLTVVWKIVISFNKMSWYDVWFLSVLNVAGGLFAEVIINISIVKIKNEVFDLFQVKEELLWKLPLIAVLLFLGELAAITIYQKYRELQREKENYFVEQQQIKAMKLRLEEAENFYGSIRKVRHEMKNHMTNIKGLAARDQYEEIDRYIEKLDATIEELDYKYATGNAVTDVLINDKYKKAIREEILFDVKFDYRDSDTISVFDMGMILNNLLDNAIEACRKIEKEKRYIRLSLKRKDNFLLITVENSFDGILQQAEDGLPRTMKETELPEILMEHGVGLRNVRELAERYFGAVNIEAKLCLTSSSYYSYTAIDGNAYACAFNGKTISRAFSESVLGNDRDNVSPECRGNTATTMSVISSLAKGSVGGLHMLGRETVKNVLANVGITPGKFRVSVDGQEKVYYMADDGEIYTEKRALDRIDMYNKNTWLNNQSVGDKIMVFGREYPIGEDGHIHVPTEDFWTSGRCNYGKAI